MKKKFGFLSLIMTLTLVACSNNNDAELVSENVVERKSSEDTEETDKEEVKDNEETEEKKAREKENERDTAKENNESKERQQKEDKKKQDDKEKERPVAVKQYTDEEMIEMTEMFYEWAVERAEIGAMAVTNYYFGHGAAGRGDWVAKTPHGEVQAQNLNNPGWDAFELHAIGGVAFYQPITGDFGRDENKGNIGTGAGYTEVALPDTDIHKYMLVDNGIVYELIGPLGLSNGFAEYTDDGKSTDYIKNELVQFEVSGDTAAQEEWRRILSLYE